MGHIWDKRKGESRLAYDHFLIYLNLGRDRTTERASEIAGVSASALQKKSVKYEWVKRCKAWDQHKAEIEAKELREAAIREAKRKAEKWSRRSEDMSEIEFALFQAVGRRLNRLLHRENQAIKMGLDNGGDRILPTEKDWHSVERSAVKMVRLARAAVRRNLDPLTALGASEEAPEDESGIDPEIASAALRAANSVISERGPKR